MRAGNQVSRRDFLNQSLAVAGTAGIVAGTRGAIRGRTAAAGDGAGAGTPARGDLLPCGRSARRGSAG